MGEKVAVGISGGVDSAVTAALLKEQGHDVVGVHLYCWDKGPYCTADKDRASALRVAKHLDVPFVVWDLRKEYKKRVIDYFFEEHKKGRTPNPDVMCNREIKFGIFMEKALKELKVDKVATGHYARIVRSDKQEAIGNKENLLSITYHLFRGVDETKDQSYFLWILTPKQLERIIFPIGRMTKKEVRAKAKKLDLPCAERPDSQGICFVGPVNVAKFLREHLSTKKGPVENTKGEVIGEHDGVWFYTEGQRRGFRVFKPSYPLYVIKKDLKANTLIVGRGKESEVEEFVVGEVNWIVAKEHLGGVFGSHLRGGGIGGGMEVGVRIRHLGEIMPAKIKMESRKLISVKLSRPARGVAPGQSAVFYNLSEAKLRRRGGSRDSYKGEEVLGGGVISKI